MTVSDIFGGPRSRTLLALSSALLLGGCQSIELTAANTAQLRVMHVSPDAGAVDIYQNSAGLAYGMGFGAATTYVPMTPGSYALSAERAGSRQVLASINTLMQAGRQYTLLLANVSAGLQQTLVADKSQPAAPGQTEIRLLDEVTRGGPVDVYLLTPGAHVAGATPVAAGITFNGNGGYVSVPAGKYSVAVLPAGSVATPLLSGPQVAYESGSVHTVVLIDGKANTAQPGMQTILVTDVEAP